MKKDLSRQEMINRIECLESELAEIKKKEDSLVSLFTTMSEGFCLHEVIYDSGKKPVDYRIIDVNPAYENITSIKKEDAVNKNASIVYGTGEAPFIEEFSRVAETGNSESLEVYWPPMKKHFIISVFSPEKGQFATVFMDITRQKEQEEALRESEKKYRRLTENSPDMIYRMSLPDGKYEYVSPASESISGYRPEEWYMDELLIQKIIHPDWHQYFNEQWELLLQGKMPPTYEYQIIHKDGAVRWLNQRNILVTGNDGKPAAIEGIVTDITDRKQYEIQLLQVQKMESIGTLAGGIAHDFNNMLSPIMISAELAMMALQEDNPVQKDLKTIHRAGERARDLVSQILAFARKSDEIRTRLHAIKVVKDSLKFMRSTIPTTIDIQYEIKTGNDVILADKTRLNQIVMNLFTNAAHAMKEK